MSTDLLSAWRDLKKIKEIAEKNLIVGIIALFTVVSVILIYIGGVAGGLNVLSSLFTPKSEELPLCKPVKNGKVGLLGESGWIKIGDYYRIRVEKNYRWGFWGEANVGLIGPDTNYYKDVSYKSDVSVGDVIYLKRDLRVFVNNIRNKGISNINLPPFKAGESPTNDDLTNVVLFAGNKVLVQATVLNKTSDSLIEVWARVAYLE